MKCNTGLTAKSQQITSLIDHEADILCCFVQLGKERYMKSKNFLVKLCRKWLEYFKGTVILWLTYH